MSETVSGDSAPRAFVLARAAIERAVIRRELTITNIPSPSGLAPWSLALSADVCPARHDADSDVGTGRLILLHDPNAPAAWAGVFRIVCFAQAPLESVMGVDPFLADVAWSWLVDALDTRGARYHSLSGTATKILSTGFGELAEQGDGAQLELRASWTPNDHEVTAHVDGWSELLCMMAGLPPVSEGVTALSSRRAGRE